MVLRESLDKTQMKMDFVVGEGEDAADNRIIPWWIGALNGHPPLRRGELMLLGARTGVGKTQFLASMAYSLASQFELKILLVSSRLTKEEIEWRILDSETAFLDDGVPLDATADRCCARDLIASGRICVLSKLDGALVGEGAPRPDVSQFDACLVDDIDRLCVSDQDVPAVAGRKMRTLMSSLKRSALDNNVAVVATATCHQARSAVSFTPPKVFEISGRLAELSDRVLLIDRSLTLRESEQPDRPKAGVVVLECAKDTLRRGSTKRGVLGDVCYLFMGKHGSLRDIRPEDGLEVGRADGQTSGCREGNGSEALTGSTAEYSCAGGSPAEISGRNARPRNGIGKREETVALRVGAADGREVVPEELIIDSFTGTAHGGVYVGRECSPKSQQAEAREFEELINGRNGNERQVVMDPNSESPIAVPLDEDMESALAKGVVLRNKDCSYAIDWKTTFLGIGIEDAEAVLSAFGLRKGAPKDQAAIGALFRVLSGQPISIVELVSSFTEDKRQRLLRLALSRNLFPMDAVRVAEVILGRRKANDHDAERVLYLLTICRKSGLRSRRSFSDEVFARETNRIPSVYSGLLQSISSQVKAVCNSSVRPSILLRFPEGAPRDELAIAIAKAVSPDCSFGLLDGGVSSGLDIVGSHSAYSNARASSYTEVLAATRSRTYVITNVHQLSSIKKDDGDPVGYVRQLLNSRTYPKDAFVDASLVMDGALFVVTESSGAKRSEFESQCGLVVNIPSLTRDEKILAARELLEMRGITPENDQAVIRLVDDHAYDAGIAMLRSSIDMLAEHADQMNGVLAEPDVLRLLPSPDVDDERYLLARSRRSLERMGDGHIAVAEKLLEAVLEERKTGECIERDASAKLRLLCKAAPAVDAHLSGNYDSVCSDILRTHPGIPESTVSHLCSAIIASVRNVNHVRPLLLVGPAGVGKTTLVRSVARSLGAQITKRDMSSLAPGELFGTVASPSAFTEIAATNNGMPMVFLLDEIDKMSPQLCDSSALCSLLDQAIVTDCYLNLSMDFSNDLFVLTANDLTNVSDYIINRVQVIAIDGYTPSEKGDIARFLIERKAKEMRADAPRVDPDALDWLARLDDEAGVRKLETRIESLISTNEGMHVTREDVIEQFATSYIPECNGIKVVMPREGSKGGAACASINYAKKHSGCIESIAATDAFKRSLSVAGAACRFALDMVNMGGICTLEEMDDIDRTYSPCSELGVAVAIYSAHNNLTIGDDIVFMGALSLSGSVSASDEKTVRKAPFIISRAAFHKATRLVCPVNFANNEEAIRCAARERIDLIGVRSLNEATKYVEGRVEIDSVLRELSC